jgi:hypothetical protein
MSYFTFFIIIYNCRMQHILFSIHTSGLFLGNQHYIVNVLYEIEHESINSTVDFENQYFINVKFVLFQWILCDTINN